MPTTRFYPKITHSTLQAASSDIVKFLMNNHAAHTGPGWILIEAQAGSSRQVPPVSSSLSSLTTAAAWVSGTQATGSWVVLESRDANTSNHFQLYLEYNSTSVLNFMIMPHQNFVTGGVAVSPPTFPTGTNAAFAESGSMFSYSIGTAAWKHYSVIADEGMMILVVDDMTIGGLRWTYLGEIDAVNTGSDPRAYVCWDLEAQLSLSNTAAQSGFNRLSQFDSASFLITGWPTYPYGYGISDGVFENPPSSTSTTRGGLGGFDFITSIGVFFNDTGHVHFAGWLRNVFACSSQLSRGTANNRQYLFLNGSTSFTQGSLCFAWDGRTRY